MALYRHVVRLMSLVCYVWCKKFFCSYLFVFNALNYFYNFIFNEFILEQKLGGAPQFVRKFQSVTIYEGDSLTLYCKAVGAKIRMNWSKDGTPLKSGGSFK